MRLHPKTRMLIQHQLLTLTSTGGKIQVFTSTDDGRGGERDTWVDSSTAVNLNYSLNKKYKVNESESEAVTPIGDTQNINLYFLHLPPGTADFDPKNRFVDNGGTIYEIISVDQEMDSGPQSGVPLNVEVQRHGLVALIT